MARIRRQQLVSVVWLLMLVLPSSEGIRNEVALETDAQFSSNLTSSVDPTFGLIAGTVAVIGSFYSWRKTTKLIKQNEHDTQVANELIAEYREAAEEGCDGFNRIDAVILSQIESLKNLGVKDPDGSLSRTACGDTSRSSRLEAQLKLQLSEQCEALKGPGKYRPAWLNALVKCNEAAKMDMMQSVCGSDFGSPMVQKKILQLNIARVHLDGLMAGLCDTLPGHSRTTEKVSFDSITYHASYLQREETVTNTGIIDWIGIIGLLYSAIGTADFGLDLYDTAVNTNQGYTALLSFVQAEHESRRTAMCNSLIGYWHKVAHFYAWTAALMVDRYQELGADIPSLTPVELMDGWNIAGDDGDDKGPWTCDEKRRCLVKVSSLTDSKDKNKGTQYPIGTGYCHNRDGEDFLVCSGEGKKTIAPIACFEVRFPKNRHELFFKQNTRPSEHEAGYDQKKCEEPYKLLENTKLSLDIVTDQVRSACSVE